MCTGGYRARQGLFGVRCCGKERLVVQTWQMSMSCPTVGLLEDVWETWQAAKQTQTQSQRRRRGRRCLGYSQAEGRRIRDPKPKLSSLVNVNRAKERKKQFAVSATVDQLAAPLSLWIGKLPGAIDRRSIYS